MARRKFYKKLKYNIKLIDVEENEIIGEEDITENINIGNLSTQVVVDDDANIDFID